MKANYKKIHVGIIFFLSSFFLEGCRSDKSALTIIDGNIQFPPAEKIYFYAFADTSDIYMEKKSALDSCIIDRNQNFSFSLLLKSSCAFDLVCGNKNLVTNLFIGPGDKITINFSGKNRMSEVISSDDAGKFNAYLIKFLDAFYTNQDVKEEYYIRTNYMDIQQFTSYSETRKQKQFDFFNSFFRGDSLSQEFRDDALNTINYGIAVDRLMFLWKKRIKNETVIPDSSYFSFATPAFIENKKAFNCPAYIRFLNLYIKDIYEREVERGELSAKLIPAVEKYKLAVRLLHKPFRDAVVFNIIFSDMHNVSSEESLQPLPALKVDSMAAWFEKKYSLN
jgi:hypothetical protein